MSVDAKIALSKRLLGKPAVRHACLAAPTAYTPAHPPVAAARRVRQRSITSHNVQRRSVVCLCVPGRQPRSQAPKAVEAGAAKRRPTL